MADKITWQLGADASQVRAEMTSAMNTVNKATGDMTGSFGRLEGAHGKVTRAQSKWLESSNRVTNQIGGFTRELLNARSATDVLAAGMNRLENSTKLSLGAGALLAGGAVLIGKIAEIRREYDALNKEIDRLTAPRAGANFQSFEALESNLTKVADQLKELREIQKNQGGTPYQWIADWFTGGEAGFDVTAPSKRRNKQIASLADSEGQARVDLAEKNQVRRQLREDALAGEPDFVTRAKKVQADANEKMGQGLDAAVETLKNLELSFREIAADVAGKRNERANMSLSEIAATPEIAPPGMTYAHWKAGQDARRAKGLDAQAEAARLNFDPTGAHNLFNLAGEAKEGITNLKPSERMSADFKGALKITEDELKIIANNTGGMFRGR